MSYGIYAQQIRNRLDTALAMLHSVKPTDLDKMTELWAIMSDIQLWMRDLEEWRDATASLLLKDKV